MIASIIRFILSILLLFGIWTETGIWTTVFATLILINTEIVSNHLQELYDTAMLLLVKSKYD